MHADDAEWFFEEGDERGEHEELVHPDDLPWAGVPWPPYLPRRDGTFVGITLDNVLLCTPQGWRWVAIRIVQLCEGLPGTDITAYSHHEGRLLVHVTLQSRHANGSSRRSEQDRRAFIRLQASIERLCDETLLMCEVCGGPVPQPPMEFRKRTLCEDHGDSVIHPDEPRNESDEDPDADLPW
jgi:hypothetical protein